MTPDSVPPDFSREMGCTTADLLAVLPKALPGADLRVDAQASKAVANLGGAVLELSWQSRPPRRIALLQIPVLVVHFRYVGFDAAGRHAVQRRFDLATQRGGG